VAEYDYSRSVNGEDYGYAPVFQSQSTTYISAISSYHPSIAFSSITPSVTPSSMSLAEDLESEGCREAEFEDKTAHKPLPMTWNRKMVVKIN
jgi:hypothetical protein